MHPRTLWDLPPEHNPMRPTVNPNIVFGNVQIMSSSCRKIVPETSCNIKKGEAVLNVFRCELKWHEKLKKLSSSTLIVNDYRIGRVA